MWFDGCVYLTISHHFAKFRSHRSCQRGYATLLLCHVTTQHHFFRETYESIGRFFKPEATNLSCWVVKDLTTGEILSFELVTWPHMITWSESHLTWRVSFSYHKSPPCQVSWPWVLEKRGYFVLILSRNLMSSWYWGYIGQIWT